MKEILRYIKEGNNLLPGIFILNSVSIINSGSLGLFDEMNSDIFYWLQIIISSTFMLLISIVMSLIVLFITKRITKKEERSIKLMRRTLWVFIIYLLLSFYLHPYQY